jgi:hypothetical protein
VRPRWILPVVLVAVLVTAAAGLVARAVYTRPVDAATAAIVPNANPVPPADQPGDPTVTATTDAAAHPLYEPVRALLQTYFDAINARHYDKWRTVVSARRAKFQPEKDWGVAYRSTRDGSITIYRIESGPSDAARILLSFTSVQDPKDAPLELPERCIRWKVIFPITLEDGTWKLDSGPTSSAPQHESCEVP